MIGGLKSKMCVVSSKFGVTRMVVIALVVIIVVVVVVAAYIALLRSSSSPTPTPTVYTHNVDWGSRSF
jgi:ABC-type transporter Mla subunit MlaD